MSAAMTKIAKKKGRLPALVASLGILAWMAVVTLVGLAMQIIAVAGQSGSSGSSSGLFELENGYSPGFLLGALVQDLLVYAVPFCLGVFLSLWAIAPISHELTLRFVLTRGALAGAAGAIVGFVVLLFVNFFGSFGQGTAFFGNSFPFSSFDGGLFLSSIGGAIQGLILTFLHNLPLVLLATVLLWLWLKAHPREYAVSGLIDDV